MLNIENQAHSLLGIHSSGIRLPNLCIHIILQFLRSERIYINFMYEMRVAIYRCYEDDIDDENVYRYG